MRQSLMSVVGLLCLLFVGGCTALEGELGGVLSSVMTDPAQLSMETIVAGLKEALAVGTNRAVAKTGKKGGYADNPKIRIPLPPELDEVGNVLRKIGMGGLVTQFESKMNLAAEHAAQQAAPVFVDAVKQMTFADAKAILHGEGSAATDYFKKRTGAELTALYKPIAAKYMNQVGAVRSYNDLMARYNRIPFAPKPKFTLDDYVADKAVTGLFTVLAQEERKIRKNPAARTTELLKRVFAGISR